VHQPGGDCPAPPPHTWVPARSQLIVGQHVAVLVLDAEPTCGVPGLLAAVAVHRLHRAVGVLPPLVVGRVHLLLACVELDLLGAVPTERGARGGGEMGGDSGEDGFNLLNTLGDGCCGSRG